MMTMSTDVGQVQEHEAGSDPGLAVDDLGSNDRAGPCGDVPLGRDRCTMGPQLYSSKERERIMAIVHNVQVHPIYSGHVNDHKVLIEREFTRYEDAIEYRDWYNDGMADRIAVYTGAIDTLTGENL